MSSSASKLSFTTNPRTCESEDFSIFNSGCIEGLHTTHKSCYGIGRLGKSNLNTKTIHQAPSAPPAPMSNLVLANYYTARKTSINVLLVTICVVSTFVAALGFSSSSFKEAYLTGKDAITSRSIIAMNSLVFIVSLVTDMFLLHKFTYKWELQMALFALFGAYICLMKVMIPQAALPLFLLSVPFLLFAAAEDVVVPYACSSTWIVSGGAIW